MNIENLFGYESLRYEKKYICSNLLTSQARLIIKSLPSQFIQSFSPRFVNNIYFDSLDKDNYQNNIDGIGDRHKVRVRWYNKFFGYVKKPKLEIKSKKNHQNYKNTFAINNFYFEKNLKNKKNLKNWINKADIPGNIQKLLYSLHISSMNSYYREYFISTDNKIRITLDSEMTFYDVGTESIIKINAVDNDYPLIELKYNSKLSSEGDNIANEIPFRINRHSKYILGVEKQLFNRI
jgi:hypothetical protein